VTVSTPRGFLLARGSARHAARCRRDLIFVGRPWP
jgi:hypothetical protein